jgi:hypothetical protein
VFLGFSKNIGWTVTADLDLYLVADNYGPDKAEVILQWLPKRPCYYLHFTDKRASWLRRVERWFA